MPAFAHNQIIVSRNNVCVYVYINRKNYIYINLNNIYNPIPFMQISNNKQSKKAFFMTAVLFKLHNVLKAKIKFPAQSVKLRI